MAAFVDAMAASRKPATITRYVASLNHLHRAAGLPAPGGDELVRLALRRMRRVRGTRQRQAAPLGLGSSSPHPRQPRGRIGRPPRRRAAGLGLRHAGRALRARRPQCRGSSFRKRALRCQPSLFLPSCFLSDFFFSFRGFPASRRPGSCFCPQSVWNRCMMGSDEERTVDLRMRSHRRCCSRICDLPGPSSRRWDLSGDVRCPEPPVSVVSAFHCFRRDKRSGGCRWTAVESKGRARPEHPVQHHRQLARQRHLRLFHARALGDGQRPAL
jgi:hypothetical protein